MGAEVDDRLAIRNVIAQLAHAADTGTVDDYVALLTDDVVWELPGTPVARGADAMAIGIEARRAAGTVGPGSHTRHVVSTVEVHVDGDVATSLAFWEFLRDCAASPKVSSVGMYRDTLRRTGRGWKVAHRVISRG
ncbi:MAG TPA: nuclear transport factor 2 family protein [Acidimicrobiales bacterium]|jgi:ketosteroid isomerase-like protein|nr:nuclear transport factor 2 family protein [Acidimicrobiales bacterium]